ncbi:hypothetical protein LJR129_004907 [Acidovorax sp. LjRoot129]|uniref:hypothetical protein n=1 Tax=unclassified Acidovorax TaxID=2684926 RepID=UPI003ECC80C7
MTVVTDSGDTLVVPRSALLQVPLIATVVDVTHANYPSGVKTKITLTEQINGVDGQRGSRTFMVMESYQAVCMLIKHAENHDHT